MSELLKVNVNDHTEKKNNLTYLSWAWAWAEVLKFDPTADWYAESFKTPEGATMPCMFMPDGSAMVKVNVAIKGKSRTCMLPVMDHRNKAIKNPDAFAINTAIMRCMTKAISMHGLGLYIYAGEDLPEGEEEQAKPPSPVPESFRSSATMGVIDTLPKDRQKVVGEAATYIIERFEADDIIAAYEEANAFLDDERVALSGLLPSNVRSALKKHGVAVKSAALNSELATT